MKLLFLAKTLRILSLPVPFEKEMLVFSHNVASTAELIQMNLCETKNFLTNVISVHQNKLHRIVQ